MKINQRVEYILDKALDRQEISSEDALELMKTDEMSPEMYAIISTGNSLSREEFDNIGEVHSQVGINSWPCPKNCKYCFFGEAWGLIKEPMELSADQVVSRARGFEKAGANIVYLMITANYPFGKYIEIAKEVRKALSPGMPMAANIGDFGPEEARQLEDAGFQGVYHIFRPREGIDTNIDPETRKRTFEAIRDSNLALSSCIEPIGPEHTPEELVAEMFRGRQYKPNVFAVMNRVPIPGTPLAKEGTISALALARVAAVTRIVFGDTIKCFGLHEPRSIALAAGANAIGAESGSNPRDTAEDTSKGIGLSVGTCRKILKDAGYKPLEGFSSAFRKETQGAAVC